MSGPTVEIAMGVERRQGRGARKSLAVWPAWLMVVAVQLGCAQPPGAQVPVEVVPQFDGKPRMLGINGFNYTDLTISSFSVGGAGGGNIFVSSPTSGGGGTSCCVVLYPGALLPKRLSIEWMRFIDGRDRWCRKTVLLRGPIPPNPTAIGVHFMPDGEIEVEVTHGYPSLKLRLENFDDGHRRRDGNVIHDEEKAKCSNVR